MPLWWKVCWNDCSTSLKASSFFCLCSIVDRSMLWKECPHSFQNYINFYVKERGGKKPRWLSCNTTSYTVCAETGSASNSDKYRSLQVHCCTFSTPKEDAANSAAVSSPPKHSVKSILYFSLILDHGTNVILTPWLSLTENSTVNSDLVWNKKKRYN